MERWENSSQCEEFESERDSERRAPRTRHSASRVNQNTRPVNKQRKRATV